MKLILAISLLLFNFTSKIESDPYYSYIVGESKEIKMFWKDEKGKLYRQLNKIPNVSFATNGGMFLDDLRPCGLFISEGKVLFPINKAKGGGSNFSMQPNGIFYVKNNGSRGVCKTEDFKFENVKYATQSGPMLVVDGNISPAVINLKKSKYPRNGVGLLPNGEILFAMSKQDVSLYEFALFFQQSKCINALHLDGAISEMQPLSPAWGQEFGVMIGVVK